MPSSSADTASRRLRARAMAVAGHFYARESKGVAIREAMDLLFWQSLMAKAGEWPEQAPGDQPIDGRLGNAEHVCGFRYGVGQ